MRLIKTFGLAAIAAVAAMAFVGATSALAANTQLCTSHTALTCGAAATGVSMTNSGLGSGVLLTDLVDILCLNITGSGNVLALANPQQVHVAHLLFTNCGTKSTHSNCTVSVLELPLANLNKTGLDTGTITGASGGLVLVRCENIDIFGIDIHCIFDATGSSFAMGAQHLTADDTWITPVEGELCPEEAFLDGLLRTAGSNRYILA